VTLPFYFEVAVSYVTVPGAIALVLLRSRMAQMKKDLTEGSLTQ